VSDCTSPIFIVGPPRSGTHLVRFCLAQHSRLHIGPETAFFMRVYGNRRLDRRGGAGRDWGAIVDRMLDGSGDPTMADVMPHRAALREAVRDSHDYSDFADRFFGFLARENGKVRWGEKTPLHALYIGQIIEIFPEARVIFVMREAKNTIASTLKSGHVRMGLEKALAVNVACRREFHRFAGHPNVFTVDYEAFVQSPQQALERISRFLGEAFEPEMLRPGMVDSSYSEAVMERRDQIGINPDNPDKWKSVLGQDQAMFIDATVAGARRARFARRDLKLKAELALLRLRVARNRLGLFNLRQLFG
jgi:hypothetical protein